MSRKTVALVMPPCWSETAPPLGLGFVARYLESHGFPCTIFELNIQCHAASEHKELWDPVRQRNWVDERLFRDETLPWLGDFLERSAQEIAAGDFLCLGLSVYASSVRFSIALCRRLRELRPDLKLIWGGPSVHNTHELSVIPSHLVDCAVIGEGEETMLEIVSALDRGGDLPRGIHGTAVPVGPSYGVNPGRPEITKLDQLPFPTYDGFPLQLYTNAHHHPLLISRGCPMRCSFCDTSLRFRRFRCRSAENVMEEIEYHAESRRVLSLGFFDASINGNPRTLRRLVELLEASPRRFRWAGNFVVQRRLTEALYQAMARTGCFRLLYGIESGSDHVLKLMNKHFNADQAGQALRWGHAAGIENHVNFICGFPGETEQHFEETLRFVERHHGSIHTVMMVTLMFIVPETPIYVRRHELGITLSPTSHFYWHDDKGNTIELRRERLRRLVELIRSYDIPVLATSLGEVEIDYRPESAVQASLHQELGPDLEAVAPAVAAARGLGLSIADIRLCDGQGATVTEHRPGSPLIIEVEYAADRAVHDPLMRVQIFNNENPARRNLLVFGTNTARLQTPLGTVGPGRGTVRLTISSLNLVPGTYPLTIGLWPDEASDAPLDARHGSPTLKVSGTRSTWGDTAHLEAELTVRPAASSSGTDSPVAQGRLQLGQLEPLDSRGRPATDHRSGESLRLRVPLASTQPHPALLVLSINRGDLVVHWSEAQVELLEGQQQIEACIDALNILAGEYELALLVRVDGGEEHLAFAPLRVTSRPTDGAGLVFCPAAFSHRRLLDRDAP